MAAMRGELAPMTKVRTLLRLTIGATAATTALNAVITSGTFSTLISRVTTSMPTCGRAWVSRTTALSLRPPAPPLALMSAIAHSRACTWSSPNGAAEPVVGSATPSVNGSLVCASARVLTPATAVRDSKDALINARTAGILFVICLSRSIAASSSYQHVGVHHVGRPALGECNELVGRGSVHILVGAALGVAQVRRAQDVAHLEQRVVRAQHRLFFVHVHRGESRTPRLESAHQRAFGNDRR